LKEASEVSGKQDEDKSDPSQPLSIQAIKSQNVKTESTNQIKSQNEAESANQPDGGKKDSIDLHVFLDINSIEVFIDGGRYVMTGNVYPDLGKDDEIYFFAEDGSCTFKDLVKYDIEA
jgi:sucrose-6-phosphate hydrolase SacC (GH32 family)